jgi:Pyruvate/2-oxoacid:ferredoxin oxidoreductase delta subunit
MRCEQDQRDTVEQVIALYDASLAESGNCGASALRALSLVPGYEIDESLLRVGAIHAYGSRIGNRCSIVQAALILCSLLYGRESGDGNRIPTKELAAKLQSDFQQALGHCHCDTIHPDWESGKPCAKSLSDAALTVASELLLDAPVIVEKTMNSLKKKFKVDESLRGYANFFMTGADWAFVAAAEEDGLVDVSVFKTQAIQSAYKRGVIDKITDESGAVTGYRLGTFHRRIDCFLRGERAKWYALPLDVKHAVIEYEQDVRRWVLPHRKPGENLAVVNALPLERALEEIYKAEGLFFVQECDCRIYRENFGGHPMDVCLHFPKSHVNTAADRGYARLITREEAAQVLKRSDAAGLVHNFEGDAFCNCCGCCCWAIRGIAAWTKEGLNPFAEYINAPYIAKITDACVGCGACVKSCPVQALSVPANEKKAVIDAEKCIGCGVCRTVCRKAALGIRRRQEA